MDLLRKADCFQSHPTLAHGMDPAHLSREQARGHCTSSTPGFNSDHGLVTLSPPNISCIFLRLPNQAMAKWGEVP